MELVIWSAIDNRARIGYWGRLTWFELGCPDTKTDHYKRYRHSSRVTKLIRLGFVIRTRITSIRARIASDICIRVRITGIRVRIAMRGRIAEFVLGCSGHYIDPVAQDTILIQQIHQQHAWRKIFDQQFQSVQTKFLHQWMWQNSQVCRRACTARPLNRISRCNFKFLKVMCLTPTTWGKVPVPKSQGNEESSLTLTLISVQLELSCRSTQRKNVVLGRKNCPVCFWADFTEIW